MTKKGKLKTKPETEWKRILTSEQFGILRRKATETPFTGVMWTPKFLEGMYVPDVVPGKRLDKNEVEKRRQEALVKSIVSIFDF